MSNNNFFTGYGSAYNLSNLGTYCDKPIWYWGPSEEEEKKEEPLLSKKESK